MFNKRIKKQIEFLTDIVYDLERRNEKLEARVEKLERGELSTNGCDGLHPHPYGSE